MADLQGEAWHKEQRRRSQDLIRVFNPTDEDFVLVWEDQKFIVPAKNIDKGWGKGMRVLQRYLARKYTKEIVDKMLMSQSDKELLERKGKLQERGDVDPTYNANIQLQYSSRTDNSKVREPIEDQVWMGIEEEFGVDQEFIEVKPETSITQEDPFKRLANKKYQPEKIVMPEIISDNAPVVTKKKPV